MYTYVHICTPIYMYMYMCMYISLYIHGKSSHLCEDFPCVARVSVCAKSWIYGKTSHRREVSRRRTNLPRCGKSPGVTFFYYHNLTVLWLCLKSYNWKYDTQCCYYHMFALAVFSYWYIIWFVVKLLPFVLS